VSSSTRTGAEIIVDTLVAAGVRHVFGIVSIHNMPIVDAMSRTDGIELITARHESSAAHMADGYARATGNLGVALGSTGPGTTNLMTGLYESAFASSRMLAITGQAETGFYGKGKGYVHEAENQKLMLETVAGAVASPRNVGEVGPMLNSVIESILSGRPQPGAIEVPIDLQYAPCSIAVPELRIADPVGPEAEVLLAATTLIANASKRMILVGGGISSVAARDALQAFAEKIDAPVFTSPSGKGSFPVDHPLHMGNALLRPPIKKLLAEADVLIAIGTRFQAGTGGIKIKMQLPALVHIDIDPHSINLNFNAEVGMISDAKVALDALLESEYDKGDAEHLEKIQSACGETNALFRERLGPDHAKAMDIFAKYLGPGEFFVRDSTIPGYNWGNTLLPIDHPGGYIFPTSGAIGPGFPIGLGVAVATGTKTMILHGDGGFMFHVGELATAAQYQIPVVIVIFNDGGYGVLRGLQSKQFDGRFNGTELHTPDFVKLAESMGVSALYADNVDEFDTQLKAAMDMAGPVLIELNANNMVPIDGVVPAPGSNA
jgi:acetolactate synthase-1/2/3 large subunit